MTPLRDLARYLKFKTPTLRSTFYRYKRLIDAPCSAIKLNLIPLNESEIRMASHLASYAPLDSDDFETPAEKDLFQRWRKLPQDRAFFKMLIRQDQMWKRAASLTFRQFMQTPEGDLWLRESLRLKSKPRFELEVPYYPTRAKSLSEEKRLKKLLRQQPLLRFMDLKALGLRNVQPILERFPHMRHHRLRYLKSLSSSLARSGSPRKKG